MATKRITKRITGWFNDLINEIKEKPSETRSLNNYPGFLFDTYDLDWRIVVSDNATESDRETANKILDGMENHFSNHDVSRKELIRKASEAGDYKNLILIGRSPLYAQNRGNPLLDVETLHPSPKKRHGLIEFQNDYGSHFRLIVTGDREFDVRKSGEVLSNPTRYHLSGRGVMVRGESLTDLEIKALQ